MGSHISENSVAARKRAKQDVVHRMVMASQESRTRGGFYGNVKNHQLCHFCYTMNDRGQPKVCRDNTQVEYK